MAGGRRSRTLVHECPHDQEVAVDGPASSTARTGPRCRGRALRAGPRGRPCRSRERAGRCGRRGRRGTGRRCRGRAAPPRRPRPRPRGSPRGPSPRRRPRPGRSATARARWRRRARRPSAPPTWRTGRRPPRPGCTGSGAAVRPRVAAVVGPGDRQPSHVAGVDLREGRVLRVTGVAAVDPPLALGRDERWGVGGGPQGRAEGERQGDEGHHGTGKRRGLAHGGRAIEACPARGNGSVSPVSPSPDGGRTRRPAGRGTGRSSRRPGSPSVP